ncbi:CaiB/BaiF CoA transferase family protein [Gordonia zhaorongruii]|uniref:CaiB/BaiF CoA transferase family protein n=1 Tax=Gordonia zhaorongruii TaxID=2597659 RepID=UPI001404A88A|nr:CoA transferase [Gordonia zhaorongruii]
MSEPGLLDGVRVVESASLLTGAAVGMLLADLGADVVKVEAPRGDLMRYVLGQITPGHSPAHLQLNRNKRGVTIDLSDPGDAVRWDRLVAGADVLIDGNAVGTLARFGYDAARLDELNPRLIRCAVSGFGTTGPYAPIPAHGLLMGAAAGAYPGDQPAQGAHVDGRGGGPATAAASAAALAVAAALYRREKTGAGSDLDVSAADALLASSMIPVVYAANADRMTDTASLPVLSDGVSGPRYNLYRTADDRIVAFAALEPSIWRRFCDAVGRDDLVDAGYEGESLEAEIASLIAARPIAHWLDVAARHRLSIGPAHTSIADLRADPQLRDRNVFAETVHPVAGRFTAVGTPVVVGGHRFSVRRGAPELGEHNEELGNGWT